MCMKDLAPNNDVERRYSVACTNDPPAFNHFHIQAVAVQQAHAD